MRWKLTCGSNLVEYASTISFPPLYISYNVIIRFIIHEKSHVQTEMSMSNRKKKVTSMNI